MSHTEEEQGRQQADPSRTDGPAHPVSDDGANKTARWIFSRTALMAIGAGFAAAIGVFSAIYAKAPAWGADWTSATGLFGATFSAFVAAATAVTAAGSDKSSPKVADGTQ